MLKLEIVRGTENASRLVVQSHRRTLQAKKLELSKRQMVEARLDGASAYKAEQQKEKLALQSVVAASDEDVLKLSELLNRRLVTYEKDASRRSWWKFFMLMDQDKAGVVAYSRFLKLMRIQLEIPERQAPDKLLRSVWKALDYDETGWINSAKWGPFMKRGEGATPRPGQGLPTWKERLVSRRHSEKQAMDNERDGEKLAMAGVEHASEEEVTKLATLMNTRILTGHNWAGGKLFPVDQMRGHGPSVWYRLFRKIDPFGNGVFTFKQLLHAIREELLISEEEWCDDRLRTVSRTSLPPAPKREKPPPPRPRCPLSPRPRGSLSRRHPIHAQVWVVLIADSPNGYLNAGKFGIFMRAGEPVPPRLTNLERRRMMGVHARKQLDANTLWLIDYERVAAAANMDKFSVETTAIQKEIARLAEISSPRNSRPQSARAARQKGLGDEALMPRKSEFEGLRPASARGQGLGKGECAQLFT